MPQLSTQDILALITVLGPFAVSAAAALYKALLERLPSNKAAVLASTAHVAVSVADQVGAALPGDQKKLIAMDIAKKLAGSSLFPGRKVDPAVLDALIEATVHAVHGAPEPEAKESPSSPLGFTPSNSGNQNTNL